MPKSVKLLQGLHGEGKREMRRERKKEGEKRGRGEKSERMR